MKHDIAIKWAEALESGNYQQGRAYLRDGDRYCCLGVLCDISQIGEWTNDHSYRTASRSRDDILTLYPPSSVQDWAGITGHNPLLEPNKMWYDHDGNTHEMTAGFLNDGKQFTGDGQFDFTAIAALIRKNWETI